MIETATEIGDWLETHVGIVVLIFAIGVALVSIAGIAKLFLPALGKYAVPIDYLGAAVQGAISGITGGLLGD
ncbi:MAG: hypothetical protein DRN81_06120 [Thermoproteota archaeon]|nr:MAG: hypothetical protein DRN81_06120 [Candidatus Korarchaeota archaeon]